ncbi:MAG: amidohydrolase family protein, partial [Lachnospiraceae bacterium]|nr:amidohydrolase family protein [Lachnospiraceae bacterium]
MILQNGLIFINGEFIPADLTVEKGKIAMVLPRKTNRPTAYRESAIDCAGKMIWPGLFDIHTHGCMGFDFTKSEPEEILSMCSFYAAHGITSIFATTMTSEDTQYARAMHSIRQAITMQTKKTCGARIQGIHMEGPFFGTAKKGAHDENYLRPISQALVDE